MSGRRRSLRAPSGRVERNRRSHSAYSIFAMSNRITAITGALARTYDYDAAGNTTSYSTVTATYNNPGRLKNLSYGGTTEVVIYNALGQRIEKSRGTTGMVQYACDEGGHLRGRRAGGRLFPRSRRADLP